MPKPFTAQYSSICARCAKPINRGDLIVHGTKEGSKGRYMHSPHCPTGVSTVTVPVASTVAVPISAIVDATVSAPVVPTVSVAPAVVTAVASTLKANQKVTSRSKWWTQLEGLLASGADRIVIVGPPGTGKSYTSYALLNQAQRLTLSDGTTNEDLIGMFHLVDGATKWVDGPATAAMRNGYGLQLDEIRHAPEEVLSLLFALMDDNPRITLPTGEVVEAASGYTVIATDNANINELPEPIQDRIEACVLAIEPHEAALATLEPNERATVANYFKTLPQQTWQWRSKPTLRRMKAYSTLIKSGRFDEQVLAKLTFGESGPEILAAMSTAAR